MPKGIPTDETARQYKQRKRQELRAVWQAWEKFWTGSGAGPTDGLPDWGDGLMTETRNNLEELRSRLSDKRWGR